MRLKEDIVEGDKGNGKAPNKFLDNRYCSILLKDRYLNPGKEVVNNFIESSNEHNRI